MFRQYKQPKSEGTWTAPNGEAWSLRAWVIMAEHDDLALFLVLLRLLTSFQGSALGCQHAPPGFIPGLGAEMPKSKVKHVAYSPSKNL